MKKKLLSVVCICLTFITLLGLSGCSGIEKTYIFDKIEMCWADDATKFEKKCLLEIVDKTEKEYFKDIEKSYSSSYYKDIYITFTKYNTAIVGNRKYNSDDYTSYEVKKTLKYVYIYDEYDGKKFVRFKFKKSFGKLVMEYEDDNIKYKVYFKKV